ncbi:MAG: RNA polymerase sigma-70 factor [Acidimicrobiaceae bacterium]|nr:RNA polymerase sigma-70 factor [Ilumatobacter sp.]MCB9382307.1 RNA polymerase sigma-70 factor [Acidimicrobiaceae bacterium]
MNQPTHDEVFEAERGRLHGLAYRMLGSAADADDVVQETWLRWHRLGDAGRAAVDRPAAWLTTAASRIALDVLKSARRQREHYVGPWLPEPLLTAADPADTVEWAESLTLGFLVVLERLAPVERAVFLLGDVFGEPYAAIAAVVDRSEEACRQIATRARQRVRDERRRVTGPPGAAEATDLVQRFMAACAFGQVDELRRILLDDVVLVSDGGRDVHAARRPVVGAERVSRFLANVTRRIPPGVTVEVQQVNGEPGLLFRRGGRPSMVMAFEIDGERIAAVRLVLNPAKLQRIGASTA